MSTIAARTSVRFLTDASAIAFGIISGVITARWLGPEGKGVLSSLVFLGTLFSQLSCLGLQEASIVMIGGRRATREDAMSATIAALLVTTAVGLLAFWITCFFQFNSNWADVRLAVLVASFGLVISNYANVFAGMLVSQDHIMSTSGIMAVTSGLIALATWVLVAWYPLALLGSVLSSLVGTLIGLGTMMFLLSGLGLSFRPRWNTAYMASAFRFGIGMQLSTIVAMMSSRLDLLMVYSLAGKAQAGQYSVALTIGALVMLVPAAVSFVTFPLLARFDDHEARDLIVRSCRFAVLGSLGIAAAMALLCPIVIPIVFGSPYRPTVLPAVILIAGGVPMSIQWLLARAAAAKQHPLLMAYSYGISLLVMLMLDVVLIPFFGAAGAAVAAALSPVFGLGVCLHWYRRHSAAPIALLDLVPNLQDVSHLGAKVKHLVLLTRAGDRT